MDFILNVAPAPDEMPPAKTVDGQEVPVKPDAPTSLFVFKTTSEHHVGDILFFKVMSGTLTENMDLINQQKQTKERIAQIFINLGGKRDKVPEMYAGDIGSTVKLKDTKTGILLPKKALTGNSPELNIRNQNIGQLSKPKANPMKKSSLLYFTNCTKKDPTFPRRIFQRNCAK